MPNPLVPSCSFSKRKWESFVPFRNFDLKDHHEFLNLLRHAVLSIPGFVNLENFPYEMRSQLDVFQTHSYQFVRSIAGNNLEGSAYSNYYMQMYRLVPIAHQINDT